MNFDAIKGMANAIGMAWPEKGRGDWPSLEKPEKR
jgi:hypothetical protein